MGYIIYKNVCDPSVSVDITVGSGTVTEVTSAQNLTTRQLADKTEISVSAISTRIFTLTFAGEVSADTIALLNIYGEDGNGFNMSSIVFYNGASPTNVTEPDPIYKGRYVNGLYSKDEVYILDQVYSFDSVVITLSDVNASNISIGHIFVGTSLEIPIKPNAVLSTVDDSIIDRSNGGQVYASQREVYNSLRFETVALTTEQSHGTNAGVYDVNIRAGSSQSIIAIMYPTTTTNAIMAYGTQKKPAVLSSEPARIDSNEWYWKAKFEIIEEL